MSSVASGLSHTFHAHHPALVVLSVLLAIFASYVALEIASRIRVSGGRRRLVWLGASAVAMGGGIWSMHFVAMLGLILPVEVEYELPLTVLSMLVAIVFSGIGLNIVFSRESEWRHFSAGGVIMGLGVAAMHYIGMEALRMQAASAYDPPLVLLSILISITASTAALWLAFHLQRFTQRLSSAILMGLAVMGMHFTGMAAFSATPMAMDIVHSTDLSRFELATGVISVSVLILIVGLTLVYQDRATRHTSQVALADFGLSALSSKDFNEVHYRAVETARNTLSVEFAAIIFIDMNASTVLTVSAVERGGKSVTQSKLSDYPDDHLLKFALTQTAPITFSDLNRETRFHIGTTHRGLKSVSGLAVVTPAHHGVTALLTMFSTRVRHFTAEDAEFLTNLSGVLAILKDRDLALEGLRLRDRALEAITQGISVIDVSLPHYPTAYTNPAFSKMIGYSAEEIASKGTLSFLPDGDASAFGQGDPGAVTRVELPVKRKDGSLFTDRIAVSPIRDSNGTITHYVAVHEDVTRLRADQRRLDQKVREQSALAEFSVIAFQSENLPELLKRAAQFARHATDTDLSGIVDADVANDSVKIVGQSGWAKQLRDTYKFSELPPRALVPVIAKLKQPIKFSDIASETRFVTDDVLEPQGVRSGIALAVEGADKVVSILYILSRSVREYSDDDVEFLTTLLNLVVAVRERHAALARLRLRDRALDSISQGITVSDETTPETPIIYTNPAFAKMTGYGIDEVIGLPSKHFLAGDAPEGILDVISFNRVKRRAARFESRTRRKDGTSFLDGVATSPILNAEGELTHYVAVHEDLTESRQRDSQLRESQKMEAVGQLTGGIAHDFNNLLTVVKANAEDLVDELAATPVLQRAADMILQASDRGADLVRQLMAFARKQELEPKVVNLNGMLDPFVKLVRRTLQENIVIDVVRRENLPSVKVDPSRLENAILNLVINARDAMPDGGRIIIETGLATLDRDYVKTNPGIKVGEYVLISVSDTGSGMTKEVREKAFQPFFTTKEIGRGTGLGLSMVYGFVKQSGGHAKLYSEIGHGTTIKIYLPPVAEGTQDDAVEANNANGTDYQGSGNVLVVEDDALVRASVFEKIENLGYTVTAVDNASAAILSLERNADYALIFIDVIMPGHMTGADLAREIQIRWPGIALLMTSGYTEASALGKVTLPEGVRLLSKPYSNADLAAAMKNALRPGPL